MRGSIKILFLISCFTVQLFTQEVTLYRVNVIGNKTTSDKMIKYSAGLRDGTQIQRSDISTAVTRLWDLGLFDDISISLNNESQYGVEITINVVESPVLNNFRFDGITIRENRLKDKMLLKQGQRIKPNSTDQAIRIIEDIYKNDGYFNVDVNANIVAPKDTVVRTQFSKDILFEIKENKKFRLKNINFIGNQNFSERKLKKRN